MDAPITRHLPHVERLPATTHQPAHRAPEATALRDYLGSTQALSRQPVQLSVQVTAALWLLVLLITGVSVWLVSEVRAPGACTTHACQLATLGGHPLTTLLLTATSLGLLLTMAVITRGLTRAGSVELTLVLAAGGLGFAACLGALLIVLLALLAGVLILGALFLVLATIGRQT